MVVPMWVQFFIVGVIIGAVVIGGWVAVVLSRVPTQYHDDGTPVDTVR